LGGNEHPSQQLHYTWCFLISIYVLYLKLNIPGMHAHGCTLINGFCIEVFSWCFDRKWWMHAYIGMAIVGSYIYIYIEQVQISSLFSGDLSHLLNSHGALVGFPRRHLLPGRFPHHTERSEFLERTTVLVSP
jgi:hypothetical protein